MYFSIILAEPRSRCPVSAISGLHSLSMNFIFVLFLSVCPVSVTRSFFCSQYFSIYQIVPKVNSYYISIFMSIQVFVTIQVVCAQARLLLIHTVFRNVHPRTNNGASSMSFTCTSVAIYYSDLIISLSTHMCIAHHFVSLI